MDYQIYRLKFKTAAHFGTNGLTETASTFCADTLFSALCLEAVRMSCLDTLIEAVRKDEVAFSDGLPYIGDTYYLPKPMLKITGKEDDEGNSVLKKAYKSLAYVPIDQFDVYINGKLDVLTVTQAFDDHFGTSYLLEKAAIGRNNGDQTRPFGVGLYQYQKGSGLYVIIGVTTDNQRELIDELMSALSLTGIGWLVSVGYGKFEYDVAELPEDIKLKLDDKDADVYESLSVSLPKDDELLYVIEGAGYRMIKRRGFIASPAYAHTTQRKRDLCVMAAGATFKKRFQGQIADVSDGRDHPVYRYAKPMLMGVSK